jgi:hypothetical protein
MLAGVGPALVIPAGASVRDATSPCVKLWLTVQTVDADVDTSAHELSDAITVPQHSGRFYREFVSSLE